MIGGEGLEGTKLMISVVGDLFTDQYFLGHTRGISAEAQIPIVDVDRTKKLPGGAGNVLLNLISMGEKDARYWVRPDQNYPTKNRLMVGDSQLARWDENDWCHPYSLEDLEGLEASDVIVVADYGKGSISKEVIQHLRRIAESGTPVLVDMKDNPIEWVGSEAILFPNKSEYTKFSTSYQWIHNVVLKQSSEGLAFVEFGNVVLTRPATADFVRSVNGAGDTVIAAWAVGTRLGMGLVDLIEFSNAAAAVAVEKSLTATVTLEEIEDKLGHEVYPEIYAAGSPAGSTTQRINVVIVHTKQGD